MASVPVNLMPLAKKCQNCSPGYVQSKGKYYDTLMYCKNQKEIDEEHIYKLKWLAGIVVCGILCILIWRSNIKSRLNYIKFTRMFFFGPGNESKENHIFACFSRHDLQIVNDILNNLRVYGFRVCTYEDLSQVGNCIETTVRSGIQGAMVTVIFLSSNFQQSPWCEKE